MSLSAAAWSADGHRVIAFVAWENLDLKTQKAISFVLSAHADHDLWTKRSLDEDKARGIFVEASTWSDEIRGDFVRFYNNEGIFEPEDFLTKKPQNRSWHYVNLPKRSPLPPDVKRGELDLQLKRLLAQAPELSAEDLAWLIHLVGEVHQPLHTFRLFLLDKDAKAATFLDPTSFHTFVDQAGFSKNSPRRTKANAEFLMTYTPKSKKTEDVDAWLCESFEIAYRWGSPKIKPSQHPKTPLFLDEHFAQNVHDIARERLLAAGERLAAVLKRAYARP